MKLIFWISYFLLFCFAALIAPYALGILIVIGLLYIVWEIARAPMEG